MKLLITNDDGIDAPGLAALAAASTAIGETIVLAPDRHLSGCSHQVTTDQPIRVEQREPARHAVFGTPADCVRLGLHSLATDADWVLAGINAGGNLGVDVHYSGTVAAAREAALHGRPGIAISHYLKRGRTLDWNRAGAWVVPILLDLVHRPWKPGTYWNINLPHLLPSDPDPEIVYCSLDSRPLPLSFRAVEGHLKYDGDYSARERIAGRDVDVCFRGAIAVTQLTLLGDEPSGASS